MQVGLKLRFCTGPTDRCVRVCVGMKAEPGDELTVGQVRRDCMCMYVCMSACVYNNVLTLTSLLVRVSVIIKMLMLGFSPLRVCQVSESLYVACVRAGSVTAPSVRRDRESSARSQPA